MSYCQPSELQTLIGAGDGADLLWATACCDAADAAINAYCGVETFELPDSDSVREIAAGDAYCLVLRSTLGQAPTLVEARTSTTAAWAPVTASDYLTEPLNAIAMGRPVRRLVRLTGSWPLSVQGEPTVRITGRWGWPGVPSAVKLAARLTALRYYNRRNTPDGVTGTDFGGAVRIPQIDPDVRRQLDPVVRLVSFIR